LVVKKANAALSIIKTDGTNTTMGYKKGTFHGPECTMEEEKQEEG
jgi:hypothetical protein